MKTLKIIELLTAIREEDLDAEDERDREKVDALDGAIALIKTLKVIPRGLTNGQIERGETRASIVREAIAKEEKSP